MTLSLLVAWIIVCLAVIRGIASSGKVTERMDGATREKYDVFPFPDCMFCVTGDVLQLSFPLCGAVLFPGQGFNAEGISGRYRSHVHPQGETGRAASSPSLTMSGKKNTDYPSLPVTAGEDAGAPGVEGGSHPGLLRPGSGVRRGHSVLQLQQDRQQLSL